MNPLPTAANNGDTESVRTLLVDQQVSQADKDLALGRACCMSHLRIADLLIEHGADPNGQYESAPNEFKYGPIILASCEFLNPIGLKWLLENGADANGYPSNSGHFQCLTPLEMVRDTYSPNTENKQACIDLLVAAGGLLPADMPAQDQ